MPDDIVLFGLGGNHKGTEQAMLQAIDELAGLGSVQAVSSLYLTEPQDYKDQAPFLNAVLSLRTKAEPQAILKNSLSIESKLGRVRKDAIPKGPRLIDIDILLIGTRVIESDSLTVPHPSLRKRRFVLEPLLELFPKLRDPRDKVSYEEDLQNTKNQGIYSVRPLNYNAQTL